MQKILECNKCILCFFLLISFSLFSSSLYFAPFVFDDNTLVFSNKYVLEPSLSNFLHYWKNSNTPIIYNVWQLISSIFGTDSPAPFRLLNILFHALNGFLIFEWVKLFFRYLIDNNVIAKDKYDNKKILDIAFFSSFLFLIYPIQVESIVWISSLKEVLATTFAILSLTFFVKGASKKSDLYEYVAFALYALGMLTHPTVASLPIVFVWFNYSVEKMSFKDIIMKNTPVFIILGIVLVLHKTINPQSSAVATETLYVRVITGIESYLLYLKNAFFPFFYSFDYEVNPYKVIKKIDESNIYRLRVVFSAMLMWFIFWLGRKKSALLYHYSLVLNFFLVLTSLGFIGYAFQNISSVSDRYMYFAIVGVCLFISVFYIEARQKYNKVASSIFLSIIIIFLSVTTYRISVWSSNEKVLKESLSYNEESFPLLLSYATALYKSEKYETSLFYYEKALAAAREKNWKGNIVNPAGSNEAIQGIFKVYKVMDNKNKGFEFYKKISRDEIMNYEPQVLATIVDFLISSRNWYEADQLVNVLRGLLVDSVVIKELELKNNILKVENLIDSFYQVGLFYKAENEIEKSKEFFAISIRLKKSLGSDTSDYEAYIDNILNNKKVQEIQEFMDVQSFEK